MSNLAEALRSHAASRLAASRGRRLAARRWPGLVAPGHEGLHGSSARRWLTRAGAVAILAAFRRF